MILTDLLGWWYSRGWAWAARQLFVVQSKKVLGFFSVADLLKTLFAPFRQDAIDTRRAPIGIKLQVFGGNIVSRVLGFLIRSVLVLAGLVTLILLEVVAVFAILLWPVVPLLPVISFILFWIGMSS